MPGVASLAATQYYAYPRNAFWRICAEVFDFDPELSYPRRLDELIAHRIALWDVYAACERPGSLDSAIVDASAEVNDFATFMDARPQIERVCCNGGKAYASFKRHALPTLGARVRALRVHRLPSTSPAHAGMSYEAKLAAWREALM